MAALSKEIYLELIEALQFKFKYPEAVVYKFNSEYVRYDPYVYKWSRKLLPYKYNKAYPDNAEYTRQIVLNYEKDADFKAYLDPNLPVEEPPEVIQQINQDRQTEQSWSKAEQQRRGTELAHPAQISHEVAPKPTELPQAEPAPPSNNSVLPSLTGSSAPLSGASTRTIAVKPLRVRSGEPDLVFPEPSSRFTPQIPSVAKNLFSQGNIGARRFISRAPGVLADFGSSLGNQGSRASRAGSQLGRQVGKQVKKTALRFILANPFVSAVVIVFILFFGGTLIQILGLKTALLPPFDQATAAPVPGTPTSSANISITKVQAGCTTNPCTSDNGQLISYVITVTNNGSDPVDIDVSDQLPDKATSAEGSGSKWTDGTTSPETVHWQIINLGPGQSTGTTLAIKPPNDSFVQNTAQATVTKVYISQTPPTSSGNDFTCTTSMTADEINKYFSDNDYYNFTGTGDSFVSAANKYHLNPAIIMAVGIIETGLGNAYKDHSLVNNDGQPLEYTKNAFGITNPGGNSGFQSFSSWAEGANSAFEKIAGYGCSSLDCVGSHWAPLGVANDPNNLNANWIPNITKTLAQIPQQSCTTQPHPAPGPEAPADVPSGWPTSGKISQTPFEAGTDHASANAIDIGAGTNNPAVYATLSGKITHIRYNSEPYVDGIWGYGDFVEITNTQTGAVATYAHMVADSDSALHLGDNVIKGTQLGLVDNSGNSHGNHLHYELGGSLSTADFSQYVPSAIGVGQVVQSSYP